MKLAVVGAHGAVAARLVEIFQLGNGPAVVAIADTPARLVRAARFNLELRLADCLDAESLARSLAGCTAVVQAESCAPPGEGRRAATALCKAASLAGVRRLVFVSSADVHGSNPPTGTDEKSPLRPRRTGARSDLLAAAERQFFAECRQLHLRGYALRPAIVYGPRSELVGRIIKDLTAGRAALRLKGEGVCNCLYVDNLVAAIQLCLKARDGSGQAYLLRDAEPVTWRDFYDALAQELELGDPAIGIANHPAAGDDLPPFADAATDFARELASAQECTWRMPSTRAKSELGYRPGVPFAEGIRRTCAWWRFAKGERAPAT